MLLFCFFCGHMVWYHNVYALLRDFGTGDSFHQWCFLLYMITYKYQPVNKMNQPPSSVRRSGYPSLPVPSFIIFCFGMGLRLATDDEWRFKTRLALRNRKKPSPSLAHQFNTLLSFSSCQILRSRTGFFSLLSLQSSVTSTAKRWSLLPYETSIMYETAHESIFLSLMHPSGFRDTGFWVKKQLQLFGNLRFRRIWPKFRERLSGI